MAKAPATKTSAAVAAAPKVSAASKKAASSDGQASSNDRATPMLQPVLNQQFDAPAALQKFGTVSQRLPIGLDTDTRQQSVANLNQLLADTITLRDLYKKHHWQVVGPTFYQLHLLYDKHYEEQSGLVDIIAERIQILGGVAVAMVQVSRLLEAHQIILKNCHEYAKTAADAGDDGTNDVVVSDVMRTNELQVWFVSEHVVDTPLVRAE
jgi:starvation-inducible DNA-binding protein